LEAKALLDIILGPVKFEIRLVEWVGFVHGGVSWGSFWRYNRG
jgi:hypothetical protein